MVSALRTLRPHRSALRLTEYASALWRCGHDRAVSILTIWPVDFGHGGHWSQCPGPVITIPDRATIDNPPAELNVQLEQEAGWAAMVACESASGFAARVAGRGAPSVAGSCWHLMAQPLKFMLVCDLQAEMPLRPERLIPMQQLR